MTRFVVDASVAVKWVLPEEHSDAAGRLLNRGLDLWAPDLIWAEVGNILWKKCRRGELSEEEVPPILQSFRRYPLRIAPSNILMDVAWEIARGFDRSFYDSLYLTLALSQGCPMVTADRRLYNALQGSPLQLLWVADIT